MVRCVETDLSKRFRFVTTYPWSLEEGVQKYIAAKVKSGQQVPLLELGEAFDVITPIKSCGE